MLNHLTFKNMFLFGQYMTSTFAHNNPCVLLFAAIGVLLNLFYVDYIYISIKLLLFIFLMNANFIPRKRRYIMSCVTLFLNNKE